jgi:hypothetical protein
MNGKRNKLSKILAMRFVFKLFQEVSLAKIAILSDVEQVHAI